jgi:hypothetical protein
MTGTSWASLIALLAWLVLALGAFRSHRIGGRKAVTMALAWGAIFVFVAIFFGAMGQ